MKKILLFILAAVMLCLSQTAQAFNPIYHIGNAKFYERFIPQDSILKGKKILFLGSSVTVGATSENFSFVDMLRIKYGINAVKEAISGTTLVDNGKDSYISRLKKYTADDKFDLVVCQLSTNDMWQNSPVYADGKQNSIEDALKFIISYTRNNLKSKVVFYTNTPPRGNNDKYKEMVNLLNKLSADEHFPVVDLFHEPALTSLSEFDYEFYMYDHIHPTKAGYKLWLPYFEKVLFSVFK